MAVKKNKEIQKANEEWEYLTGDEEIKRLEFLELRAALDFNSRLDYETRLAVEKELPKAVEKELKKRTEELKERVTEELRERVKEEVREKVEEEVREKVEEEVKEEVREQGEKNKAIEIAKEMLKAKVPKEEIAKYTKLSEEEINKIENEIKKCNN